MVRSISIITCLFALALTGIAQSVQTLQWPTRFASKPPTGIDSRWLATYRLGLSSMSEAQAVGMSASAAQMIGLTQEQAGRLQRLLVPLYAEIKKDEVFKNARSALPYCYSETTPTNGLATVYFPENVGTNKPPILFLHGYGGSFLWPIHLLARAFPDRVIIAPAYGLSGGNIHPLYIQQSLRAVQDTLKLEEPLPKPVLIGLSAGVNGVLEHYGPRARQYTGAICIAGYPANETLPAFREGHRLEFLCGEKELFVQNQMLTNNLEKMKSRGVQVTSQVITGGDHFFLAEHQEESITRLKLAMSRLKE
ncbi:MAG TPA: alpha/beta hydrolase [Verrucomicrobiae bacterium]